MKQFTKTLITSIAVSSALFAGGDMAPVEPVVETPSMSGGSIYVGPAFGHIHNSEAQEGFAAVVGANLMENLAIEARYVMTFGDDDQESTNIVGFLKPQFAVMEGFNLYGLVGYGQVDHNDVEGDGLQYGAGFSYNFTQNVAFFADYTWIDEKAFEDTSADGTSLYAVTSGLTYSF